jgi:hypothetical protein
MKPIYALEGGLAGAVALTILHESLRNLFPRAPRMDLLGKAAVAKGLRGAGLKIPSGTKLYAITMAADVVSNALYYSLSGIGSTKGTVARGAALGLAAGVGAVTLPKYIGLPDAPSSRTPETKLMTVGLYVVGGIVASLVLKALSKRKERKNNKWQERLLTSSQV